MLQLVAKLADNKMSWVQSTKLMGIICLLLCVSSSLAVGYGSRPQVDAHPALVRQAVSSETRQTEIRELKQGQVIEQELPGGEAHTYHITLRAGQYFNIAIEQQGIDIEMKLFEPGGKIQASIDFGGVGLTESYWALAESTGEYRLEVVPANKQAEAGKYRISVERLGQWVEAPVKDRDFVIAYRLVKEALELYGQGTAEAKRKAIEKYQEALPLWQRLAAHNEAALSLNNLAFISSQLSNAREAVEYYCQAVMLYQAAGNFRGAIGALNNLGGVYFKLGDTQKAIEAFNEGLALARAKGIKARESVLLRGLGLVFQRSFELDKALDVFRQALALDRAAGNRLGEAGALGSIGTVYLNKGQYQAALEQYHQSVAIYRELGSHNNAIIILKNMGQAFARQDEYQEAIEYLLQALKLTQAIEDRFGETEVLSTIGDFYFQLGDYPKALEYGKQALLLERTIGNRPMEANTLHHVGMTYAALGDWQRSVEYFNQALPLRIAVADRGGEATTLASLGLAYNSFGECEKALEQLSQALALRRALDDQVGEAVTLYNIGEVYAQQSDSPKALEHFTQALAKAKATSNRQLESKTLFQLARLERKRNNFTQARSQIEAALKIVETTRTKVSLAEVRATYLATRQDFYDFYIDLLMQLSKQEKNPKYVAEALNVSERRRARALLESLTEARADIREGVSPELLENERDLQQQLKTKAERQVRLLSRKHTAEEAMALDKELQALTAEYEQVLAQIKQSSPRYAALTQPVPLGLAEIQREVLDSETLLLEYSLGEERSYLWAVTTTTITTYELPKRAEIETLARRVYHMLTARNQRVKFETAAEWRARIARADAEYDIAATELSKLILAPAAPHMNKQRLLIVSDGALQYLPFAALPSPSSTPDVPLIAKHEVVSLPSASTLAVLRKELVGRRPAPKAIAVLADPVFSKDDERLKPSRSTAASSAVAPEKSEAQEAGLIESPLTRSARDVGIESQESYLPRLFFTRREAEAIVRYVPEKQFKKAIDFAANKVTATDPKLGQYRYVHFATHTLLNSAHPGLSGIVLSLVNSEGKEQEGFLTAHEIYNLKLPAELVVLSSCKTGLGKEVKGEGVVGITRGFMYAGAARVMVSLWDVDDESTAEMMKRVYAAMLEKPRLSPAAALRSAQVAMWKSRQWRAPYFWAAFVLQGEYK